LRDPIWKIPLRLAFGSMALTVGLVAAFAVFFLGLPWGAAILLGAILAPTDPVLASDAQLSSPTDPDKLKFSITTEAGLNDGSAFPFVMLGLGLLGLHELGPWGWRWWTVDVLWAVFGGLALGAGAGWTIGRVVLFLRREHKEAFGLDEFLTLGLIAVTYGAALLLHTYGFLAVFAAGLAVRALERRHTGAKPPDEIAVMAAAGRKEEIATDPEKAPAYMAGALLSFNEQLERMLEFGLVILVSAMLAPQFVDWKYVGFVAALFFLIRPLAVMIGCIGTDLKPRERAVISWLGIRGIGSIYYLMFAIQRGLEPELAGTLTSITLLVVAISIVVHGISVSPLLNRSPG
jgi:NhaP-type Na+/H+ or K+/H+ antiporter